MGTILFLFIVMVGGILWGLQGLRGKKSYPIRILSIGQIVVGAICGIVLVAEIVKILR
ncbi:MAG: hypothetical protein GX639_11540 [Fibrobacter sp.]|nr:hypothetical protein [Fibrobacter sp.]